MISREQKRGRYDKGPENDKNFWLYSSQFAKVGYRIFLTETEFSVQRKLTANLEILKVKNFYKSTLEYNIAVY